MRQLIFLLLICSAIACSISKHSTAKSNPLNGLWIPTQQEMGGKALPPTFYATTKLTMSDTLYTLVAESVDKGIVKYKDGKMDIYAKEGVNSGKHFTAIYKIENDQLTICYNLSGKNYPETFDTKGNPLFFLSVYKKELFK